MASQWGDYQSIIQISIALNAAYFSISQFSNPGVSLQISRITDAINSATLYIKDTKERKRIIIELGRIQSDVLKQKQKDSSLIDILRFFALVLLLGGLALLWFTSVFAEKSAGLCLQIGALALNLPFSLGIGYMGLFSSAKYSDLANRTEQAEQQIRDSYKR